LWLLALVFVPSAALAAETADGEPSFDEVDRNRDAVIDRLEAKAREKMREIYDPIDRDDDGNIVRAEYEVWKREASQRESEDDRSLFTKLDTNRNRSIERSEAQLAPDLVPAFDAADLDDSGAVSDIEWARWRREMRERRAIEDRTDVD
jgi:Ca2+-binding EF-hand superfamily protein